MISTDAAPHSPEGTANPAPFLFSIPGAEPINLYPILLNGANLNIIGEHLPGPLYAKDNRGVRTPTLLYYRLYRFLKKLEKAGLLTSEKGVQDLGLGDRPCLWYRPTLAGVRGVYKPLNLTRQVQNSNSPQNSVLDDGSASDPKAHIPAWRRFPSRTNPLRIEAAKCAKKIRTREDHHLFVRDDDGSLNPDLRAELNDISSFYDLYIEQIDRRSIVLAPRDYSGDPDSLLLLPYRTRFNDTHRQLQNLDHYDYAWTEATDKYNEAVFLTLTTDPAMHTDLWTANRHMGPAWNRYMSLLQKRMGYRPKYLAVNEFQENGLIHLHTVIFGSSWLDRRDQISRDWSRCNQGRIIKAIAIVRDRQGRWFWKNEKPADAAEGESVDHYLKKYLNKAIFDKEGFEHYWTYNKRFFSCSRIFTPPPEIRAKSPESWVYIGAMEESAIPAWMKYLACKRCPAQPLDVPIDHPVASWWDDNPYRPGAPVFVPASTLPRSGPPPGSPPPLAASGGAERLPGLSLADFM